MDPDPAQKHMDPTDQDPALIRDINKMLFYKIMSAENKKLLVYLNRCLVLF
jgi:hypothetical protein